MNEAVYYPINHALDLALHRGRNVAQHAVRVPETREAERFGVPPGRYLVLASQGRVVTAVDQIGVSRGAYPTLVLR